MTRAKQKDFEDWFMNKIEPMKCPKCQSILKWHKLSFEPGKKESSVKCSGCNQIFDARAIFGKEIDEYTISLVERKEE